jgi:hypothetical protein
MTNAAVARGERGGALRPQRPWGSPYGVGRGRRDLTAYAGRTDLDLDPDPLGSSRHAKSIVSVTNANAIPATKGGTRVSGIVAPTAAALHAPVAVTRFPCRAVCRCAAVAVVPTIAHPLPNIAIHVVKPKRIGLKRASGRGALFIPSAAAVTAVCPAGSNAIAPETPPPACRGFRRNHPRIFKD